MIYLANQNNPEERHLKTRQVSQDKTQQHIRRGERTLGTNPSLVIFWPSPSFNDFKTKGEKLKSILKAFIFGLQYMKEKAFWEHRITKLQYLERPLGKKVQLLLLGILFH